MDLLWRPAPEGVRRLALAQLEAAGLAAERAQDPALEEGLHDFRVALRRLRTTLRVWRGELGGAVRKKHRRALRALQTATGAGRDAEVGLDWLTRQNLDRESAPAAEGSSPAEWRAGQAWLAERLGRRREQGKKLLNRTLRRDFPRLARELRPRLAHLEQRVDLDRPDSSGSFAAALAARARAQAERAAEALGVVCAPAQRAEQHHARIEVKRLRYLAEPVLAACDTRGPPVAEAARHLVEDCKRLQDLLGRLNDAHVLEAELAQALVERGARGKPSMGRGSQGPPRGAARAGLRELSLRLEALRERLFAELEARLAGPGLGGIRERAESLAMALLRTQPDASGPGVSATTEAPRRSDTLHVEIERKFLLSGMPPVPGSPARVEVLEIEQGWLPGVKLRERLRRTRTGAVTEFHRALKFGRGLSRTEIEEPTTEQLFASLWPLTAERRVTKVRHRVTEGALTWEIDRFTDRELVLAEVELPEPETPAVPPAWLAPFIVREVTDEAGFTNLELALPAAHGHGRDGPGSG